MHTAFTELMGIADPDFDFEIDFPWEDSTMDAAVPYGKFVPRAPLSVDIVLLPHASSDDPNVFSIHIQPFCKQWKVRRRAARRAHASATRGSECGHVMEDAHACARRRIGRRAGGNGVVCARARTSISVVNTLFSLVMAAALQPHSLDAGPKNAVTDSVHNQLSQG